MKHPSDFIYNETTGRYSRIEFDLLYTLSDTGAWEFERWAGEKRQTSKDHPWLKDFRAELVHPEQIEVTKAEAPVRDPKCKIAPGMYYTDVMQAEYKRSHSNNHVPGIELVPKNKAVSIGEPMYTYRLVESGIQYDSRVNPHGSLQTFYNSYMHSPDWSGKTPTVADWFAFLTDGDKEVLGLTSQKINKEFAL